MAFLNNFSLPSAAFERASKLNEDVHLYKRPEGKQYHIFISYRHEDRAYVPRVVKFLKSLQKGIYVDFLDEELIKAPDNQTAPILRSRINQCRKLIQIITPNAGSSKWMPWELGLGDGLLGYANAVILPVVNEHNPRIEQDYLNMYGHIETTKSRDQTLTGWAIIYPNSTAIWFSEWLTSSN
jgi:hypothetical protein